MGEYRSFGEISVIKSILWDLRDKMQIFYYIPLDIYANANTHALVFVKVLPLFIFILFFLSVCLYQLLLLFFQSFLSQSSKSRYAFKRIPLWTIYHLNIFYCVLWSVCTMQLYIYLYYTTYGYSSVSIHRYTIIIMQ